jgi:threonine dehydratase
LSSPIPDAGVVAASGGNAGLAAAYAAAQLGCRAEIFVPVHAPAVKVDRIAQYGATVIKVGESYAESLHASEIRARETGAITVHAYDQAEVVAGAGTLALELPPVDTVLVAVGGGGLIAGVAAYFGGSVRVIGVEPDGCATFARAVEAGEPVDITPMGIASDSLGAQRIGAYAWQQHQLGHISSALVVAQESVLEARQALWSELRVASEAGGATAFAALTSGTYVPSDGERIAVVICGANASPTDLV